MAARDRWRDHDGMRILVVLGPSGSGKSTVVRAVHGRGLVAVTPTWTTRPRRPDEAHGSVEHHFVDEAEFEARRRAGRFLDTVRLFGLPYAYGLPAVERPSRGKVPLVIARAPVMPLVARHCPDYVAYQIEDGHDRARERLARRTDGDLGTRLAGYEDERVQGRAFAHRVFVNNSSVAALVDAVAAALEEDFASDRTEEPCHSGP